MEKMLFWLMVVLDDPGIPLLDWGGDRRAVTEALLAGTVEPPTPLALFMLMGPVSLPIVPLADPGAGELNAEVKWEGLANWLVPVAVAVVALFPVPDAPVAVVVPAAVAAAAALLREAMFCRRERRDPPSGPCGMYLFSK